MKKKVLFLFALVLISGQVLSQKVEVMYFKANLGCCQARACAQLENQVKAIVEDNFKNGDVVFKSVLIADPTNAALVEKYEAGSQTVVIVSNKRRKKKITDATQMVHDFRRTRDREAFEKDFIGAIKAKL